MNSKRKGAAGEREFAKAWFEATGIQARRGQQFAGGTDSPDVIVEAEDLHFEVKRRKSLNLRQATAQADSDAGDKVPIVAYRYDGRGEKWRVVIPLDGVIDFVASINKAHRQVTIDKYQSMMHQEGVKE